MKGKKFLALCLSVIMLLSVFSIAAYAEDNPALDENTYYASDGSLIHSFVNNSEFPSGGYLEYGEYYPGFEADYDSRIKINDTSIFPYSACVDIICKYYFQNGTVYNVCGSGNVIGDYTILTAAHVVYNKTNGWPDEIIIKPSYNGVNYDTTYTYMVDKIIIYPRYDMEIQDEPYDIALLRLNAPVGEVTGTFGYSVANVSAGDRLTITGYPIDKEDKGLYSASGPVTDIISNVLFYDIDTSHGQSGSGVYDSSYNIVAVHTRGYGDNIDHPDNSSGTLIDIEKYHWIYKYNNQNTTPVFRLYNENTGEHFYTINVTETMQLKDIGWLYEGVAWYSPESGIPVYRLYNSNGSEHFYTTDVSERNSLVSVGWKYEGVSFYTDSSCNTDIYRLYNPNAISNNHFFTADVVERDDLISAGWIYEGIGWRAYII